MILIIPLILLLLLLHNDAPSSNLFFLQSHCQTCIGKKMDIPDPNWPMGSLLEDQRTKECGCIFNGWYKEGNDRPFKIVFDTLDWTIVSRCSLHQEEYQRQREENIRIQEQQFTFLVFSRSYFGQYFDSKWNSNCYRRRP